MYLIESWTFQTCAPLWTFDGIDEVLPGTYGTCFLYNGTGYRYNGVLEKRIKDGVATGNYVSFISWVHLWDSWNFNFIVFISKTHYFSQDPILSR